MLFAHLQPLLSPYDLWPHLVETGMAALEGSRIDPGRLFTPTSTTFVRPTIGYVRPHNRSRKRPTSQWN